MSRRLKTDIPGPDFRLDPDALRDDGLAKAFAGDVAEPLPLVVEIGFGRGEFLLDLARRSPEQAHLGIEILYKRVLKMARRLARSEIRNLRLLQLDGHQALAELLPEASVRTFWVNFPDPWPKARHARRRLVQPGFARLVAARLVPGGRIHLATDDVPYAEQFHEVLSAEPGLRNRHAPAHWLSEVEGRMRTAYEEEWRAEGRPLHFFAYERPESSS